MASTVFACGTEGHILVSYILACTHYRRQRKTIVIREDDRTKGYYETALRLGLWDEVFLLRGDSIVGDPAGGMEALVRRTDLLHFFSWGFPPYNRAFADCVASGVPVILTDEGLLTYSPRRRFASWLAQKPEHALLASGFDVSRISQVWLLEPDLLAEPVTVPVRRINIESFYESCRDEPKLAEGLRRLFRVPEDLTLAVDAVYFRQYPSAMHLLPPEVDAWIDEKILACFGRARLLVKNHPAHVNPLYREVPCALPPELPWEVIPILSAIDPGGRIVCPRVYISLGSSAMLRTAMLGVQGSYASLHKIMERYSGRTDNALDDVIAGLRRRFPDSSFPAPSTWEALHEDLQSLRAKEALPLDPTALPQGSDEIELLRGFLSDSARRMRDRESRIRVLEEAVSGLQRQAVDWEQQAKALRIGMAESEERLKSTEARLAESEGRLKSAEARLAEREKVLKGTWAQLGESKAQADTLNQRLLEIHSSTAWSLVRTLWRLRLLLAPHGSLRERAGRALLGGFRSLRRVAPRE